MTDEETEWTDPEECSHPYYNSYTGECIACGKARSSPP